MSIQAYIPTPNAPNPTNTMTPCNVAERDIRNKDGRTYDFSKIAVGSFVYVRASPYNTEFCYEVTPSYEETIANRQARCQAARQERAFTHVARTKHIASEKAVSRQRRHEVVLAAEIRRDAIAFATYAAEVNAETEVVARYRDMFNAVKSYMPTLAQQEEAVREEMAEMNQIRSFVRARATRSTRSTRRNGAHAKSTRSSRAGKKMYHREPMDMREPCIDDDVSPTKSD
jgi:hypothetical protein